MQRKKSKNGRPDLSGYKHEPRVSLRQDVARFLVYARKHAPGVFFTYPEIVMHVNNYSKMPRVDSHEAEAVRRNISGIRKMLMEQEDGCSLVTHPILGVRATVDSVDVLDTEMVRASIRLNSAQRAFTLTNDLIDPAKIPNTPEFAARKLWHKTSVIPVAKAIASTDFAAKLLPPKKDDKDKAA